MRCYEHRDIEAIGVCQSCGRGVCESCQTMRQGQILCIGCAERVRAGGAWFTFRFSVPNLEQIWEELSEMVKVSFGTVCPECGRAVQPDFVACPYCGAALKKRCPNCERRVRGNWRYCPNCGASL
ncbi:MAG: zinc ribbon domain-containing protein [Armatimonadota bacterium]|nr:zinc ribbon domain-containing protein [Armatimonadota bacterium]